MIKIKDRIVGNIYFYEHDWSRGDGQQIVVYNGQGFDCFTPITQSRKWTKNDKAKRFCYWRSLYSLTSDPFKKWISSLTKANKRRVLMNLYKLKTEL